MMTPCIIMLRGINMTGHNSVKMTDLVSLFRKLGYKDAITYIQSGNVIFTSPVMNAGVISSKIREAILTELHLNIAVIVRTVSEMKEIISANPFLEEPGFDPSRMAVLFLEGKPSDDQIQKVAGFDYPPDKFRVSGNEIYVYCPNGFGKTKLYTNFFETKMKVTGTARNWRTVKKLFEMAEELIRRNQDL